MQIFSGGKVRPSLTICKQLKFITEGQDIIPSTSHFFINQTYVNVTWSVKI